MSPPAQTEAGEIQAAHEMVEEEAGHILGSWRGRGDLGVGNLDPATEDTVLEAEGDRQAAHTEAVGDIQVVHCKVGAGIQAGDGLLLDV